MKSIQITYLLILTLKKALQRATPVTISGAKTCTNSPVTDYIEFKDIQAQITPNIQGDGKTLANVRPAVFQLDPCTASSNQDFLFSHDQFITAWVKLEPDTYLSPPSTNYGTPHFLLQTADLKFQEFFGSSGQPAPTDEDLTKMAIPTAHQTWIFLMFKMKKVITVSEEYTKLRIYRTFSDHETEIPDTDPAFDTSKSLLEKCTSMLFNDRNNYNDEELTFKTDVCQFKAIKEMWMPKSFSDEIANKKNFADFLAFGGKMSVINRWSFQIWDRRLMEKIWGGQFTQQNFNKMMNSQVVSGNGIYYSTSMLTKVDNQVLNFDTKKELSSTSILKAILYRKNLGWVKQKFYFKMQNVALGIDEIFFEVEFQKTTSKPSTFDSSATINLFFYEYDDISANVKEGAASLTDSHILNGQAVETINWVFTVSVEFVPETLTENTVLSPYTMKFLMRVTVEMGPYVDDPIWDYDNEKIKSVTKIIKLKTKFHKDNKFFFDAEHGENEAGGSYDSFINDITFLDGAGSHKHALSGVTGEAVKVKDTLKGTTLEYPDTGSCMWKSLYGFECPHCTLEYRKLWFDESNCHCQTANFPGLKHADGCGAAYNSTVCRICNFYDGYFLDFFSRGKCRKKTEKCPDGFGSYSYQPTESWVTWPSQACYTCPVNCKRCYFSDASDNMFYCREAFQEVLDNGYNTTANAFNEPTCALTNCAVCEREKCDECKTGFILKVEIVGGNKELSCVIVSGNPNNKCSTGYIEARNSTNNYIPDFCYSDSAPPYGYYKKNVGYDYYEACDDSNDCTLCSVKSQIDSAGPLLTSPNSLCHSCTGTTKNYKPYHPVIDGDADLCFSKPTSTNCVKKNLTNDCQECAGGLTNMDIVRVSSFTYECSCEDLFFEDFIHQTGCKPYPHNCEFPSLNVETGLLVCKRCKDSYSREATGFCSSDCIEQCSTCNGAICDECYQGFFLSLDKTQCSSVGCPTDVGQIRASPTSYNCVNCVSGCKTCLTATTCSECQGTDYLTVDKTSCSATCPSGEGKDTSNTPKICRSCSTEFCKKCDTTPDLTKCNECLEGFILDKGSCLQCGENCQSCDSEKCLTCSDELLVTDPSNPKNCIQQGQLVDYYHQQIFDPDTENDYSLRMIVNTSGVDYFDFLEQKKENLFKIINSDSGETLDSITVYQNYIGLITFFNKSTSEKIIKITISTKNNKISETPAMTLIAKSQDIQLQTFNKIKKSEIEPIKDQAETVSTTGEYMEPSTLTASSLLIIESGDPTGALLKFNQFISLVHRLKFINIWYGEKLDPVLNQLGRWSDGQENIYKKKVLRQDNRILEFTENYENEIVEKEIGAKGKFNRFLEDFNFTLMMKIKEMIYLIFWFLHLYCLRIFTQMKEKEEICSIGKLKFIRLVRKIRFILLNSTVLDFLFFGTRFILHRKIDSVDVIPKKILTMFLMSLKIYDVMQVFHSTNFLKITMLEKFNSTKKENLIDKLDMTRNGINESEDEIKNFKKVIDFEKTYYYHKRNHTVEQFVKNYIQETKEAYNSFFILNSNGFFLLRLCITQVMVASLVNSPILLVSLLMFNEFFFNLTVILITFFTKAKIKTIHLIPKIIQLSCLTGLFFVFMLIEFDQKKDRTKSPVSASLQNMGINLLFVGYVAEILILIFGLIVNIYLTIKKKREKKNGVEIIPKIGELEGEYFYKRGDTTEGRIELLNNMNILNEDEQERRRRNININSRNRKKNKKIKNRDNEKKLFMKKSRKTMSRKNPIVLEGNQVNQFEDQKKKKKNRSYRNRKKRNELNRD